MENQYRERKGGTEIEKKVGREGHVRKNGVKEERKELYKGERR